MNQTWQTVALIVGLVGGILAILGVLWKVARLVTIEDLLRELDKLKDYINDHFVRKK